MVRTFALIDRTCTNDRRFVRIDNASVGVNAKLICGGATYPINTALFYGANGNTMHSYQWQSASNGALLTYDPTVACREVTKSACAKLKADWGSAIRIYVIKYREQTQYKHAITGAAVDFDYGYLDSCASGASYKYEAANEAALNAALQTIATDIKSFAGHSPAKNVN
jgi:hypothetical protein